MALDGFIDFAKVDKPRPLSEIVASVAAFIACKDDINSFDAPGIWASVAIYNDSNTTNVMLEHFGFDVRDGVYFRLDKNDFHDVGMEHLTRLCIQLLLNRTGDCAFVYPLDSARPLLVRTAGVLRLQTDGLEPHHSCSKMINRIAKEVGGPFRFEEIPSM